jgi:hypothetical protein
MPLFRKTPEVKAAREQHAQLLRQIAMAEGNASSLLSQLPALVQAAELSGRKARELNATTLRAIAQRVLEDEKLTSDEEQQFIEVAQGLGFTEEQLQTEFRDEMKLLVVARANDGRLPVIAQPHVMVAPNELVHLELPAALTKEVVRREYRGGSSGVSFPIAPGVRFRTGGARGRSVVVGTAIENADHGILAVTSKRTLFSGSRKTIECKHSKLVGLQVYTDGIGIGVSNRQNASVFRVEDGPFVAAMINAAAQSQI